MDCLMMYEGLGREMYGGADEQMDACTGEGLTERTDEREIRRMGGGVDGWKEGWMREERGVRWRKEAGEMDG